jgi:hypothetical protein
MFLLARRLTIRQLAVGLSLYLALVAIGPNVAIACEGTAGEEKASLIPVKWSSGGDCPLKSNEVNFTVTGKWCEYELKNNNSAEVIKLKIGELNLKSKECEEKACVVFTPGVEAGQTECNSPMTLKAGTGCRRRVEYKTKPAGAQLIGFDWTLESLPSGAKFFVETYQIVE